MAVGSLNLTRLLRPYWKLAAVAFGAMLVEGAADVLEPWPLKIIFDHVLGSKRVPDWLSGWLAGGHDRLDVLTVRRADVIFVLNDGVISERGTHEQLLASERAVFPAVPYAVSQR